MQPETERPFKGVWIPAILWDAQDLTPWQKMLVAEIDALDDGAGCYASNDHLARRMGSSASSIASSLTELRAKGWVRTLEDPSYQGRKLRVCFSAYGDSTQREIRGRGFANGQRGVCQPVKGGLPAGKPPILRDTKEDSRGGAEGGQPPTPPEVSKTASKPDKTSPSQEGQTFARWFRALLPDDLDTGKLPAGWMDRWAQTFDDLRRIDKKEPDEIRAVCAWARADNFWSGNFFTPAKLRERGRNQDLRYYELWLQQMKKPGRPKTGAAAKAEAQVKTYGLSADEMPKAFDPMAEASDTENPETESENHHANVPEQADIPFPI